MHDETVSLSERTNRAQACENAQALVSIHTNAAASHVQGIETFCHQPHLFDTVAYKGEPSLVPFIKKFNKNLHDRSCQLAHAVHTQVLNHASQQNKGIKNRKVRHEVSQLLLGSSIPSILIELGFLTHPHEKVLLQKDSYQTLLAQGVVAGVEEFLKNSFA